MQITLKQAELESAVRDYIQNNVGISRHIGEVNFTPTRGSEGIITSVEVGEVGPVNLIVEADATVTKTEPVLDTEEDDEDNRLFG